MFKYPNFQSFLDKTSLQWDAALCYKTRCSRGVQQCLEMSTDNVLPMESIWNLFSQCLAGSGAGNAGPSCSLDQCFVSGPEAAQCSLPGDCPQRAIDAEPFGSVQSLNPSLAVLGQPGASSHMKADGD